MSESAPNATLVPGQSVGDGYTIEGAISKGAMGAVYRARDSRDSEVAIKRLLDPSQSARFEIEGRLLTRLHHPRVVNVITHFEDESGSYLVMDLVQGTDLGALLEKRGVP